MNAPFYLREEASQEVIDLLEKTSLGTDGAIYLHLNTKEIIGQLDNPLFLSLERNNRALGNITFCRRAGGLWYIRYFAFDGLFQTKKKENRPQKSQGFLKNQIEQFFKQGLEEEVRAFYAYIDPKNKRSKWMSENFGFRTIGQLKTQTFSRLNPRLSSRFREIKTEEEVHQFHQKQADNMFFTAYRPRRLKNYVLEDETGVLLAGVSAQKANWRIDRMPGKSGKLLVKLIPFIPFVRKLIRPKDHHFLVIESVFVQDERTTYLVELLESLLAFEHEKLLFWWHDSREFSALEQTKINWGLFHRLLGTPPVDVVARNIDPQIEVEAKQKLIFVSGMDLV